MKKIFERGDKVVCVDDAAFPPFCQSGPVPVCGMVYVVDRTSTAPNDKIYLHLIGMDCGTFGFRADRFRLLSDVQAINRAPIGTVYFDMDKRRYWFRTETGWVSEDEIQGDLGFKETD